MVKYVRDLLDSHTLPCNVENQVAMVKVQDSIGLLIEEQLGVLRHVIPLAAKGQTSVETHHC